LYQRRAEALRRIREALTRICEGEVNATFWTPSQAIEFLREKIELHRRQMAGRMPKHIPHMATWLHQRRYLRPVTEELMPARLVACVWILACYPNMPNVDNIRSAVENFLPALRAIDKALEQMEQRGIPAENCARRLESRTKIYAMAVKEWPVEDLRFVPNPAKWFSEAQYDRPEETWRRQPANGFSQEREQLKRLLN
jgi:hypothetical protein